ncbi:patatin-like phospholipase family protein [Bosea sp. BIWAKO-01]|uniref:patatin-like phospholipase family protein n=1 Tax=Bosea sp. BIWAKO-01 TaxID=506668 RepID=UPI000852D4FB|nr:patatin-like phospholipase family protein [Bosea sp. BIWAKO-01]GAU86491.1 lipoprotein [Bosea sp. BIWAKO-01]
MMRWSRLALLAGVLALGGCSIAPTGQALDPQTLRVAAQQPEPWSAQGNGRHVLALSSGGADGAFGAGVLVGWTQSGKRPRFDLVSGVSTGALQAPLAFLGPRYDRILEAVYTTTRTADVLKGNGIGVLIKAGLNKADPLRRTLEGVITEPMLAEIAEAHLQGRRLYVTTTDLTNGRPVTWDMGRLAASGRPDARRAFIEMLVASAAPPGFVEPVPLLDTASGVVVLHGDGGVMRPIAVEPAMVRGAGRVNLWVIANGHVSSVAATQATGHGAVTLARRGVSELLRSLLVIAVERAAMLAKDEGAAFRLQRLPNAIPETENPFVFEPAEMRRLFEVGRRHGKDPASWLRAAPEAGA